MLSSCRPSIRSISAPSSPALLAGTPFSSASDSFVNTSSSSLYVRLSFLILSILFSIYKISEILNIRILSVVTVIVNTTCAISAKINSRLMTSMSLAGSTVLSTVIPTVSISSKMRYAKVHSTVNNVLVFKAAHHMNYSIRCSNIR